jgi:hypothetical protein
MVGVLAGMQVDVVNIEIEVLKAIEVRLRVVVLDLAVDLIDEQYPAVDAQADPGGQPITLHQHTAVLYFTLQK